MKRFLITTMIIAAILGSLIPGLSCGKETEPPPPTSAELTLTVGGLEAERYTNTDYGYTILYPQGWNISEAQKGTVEIRDPSSLTFISVVAYYYTDEPLSEFVALMRDICEDDMGYEILSRGEVYEDAVSEGCIDLITSGDVLTSHGIITMEEHLYMKAKPIGWALEAIVGCDIDDSETNKDLFYDIITSFRLID
jgi:hypothetical protein